MMPSLPRATVSLFHMLANHARPVPLPERVSTTKLLFLTTSGGTENMIASASKKLLQFLPGEVIIIWQPPRSEEAYLRWCPYLARSLLPDALLLHLKLALQRSPSREIFARSERCQLTALPT